MPAIQPCDSEACAYPTASRPTSSVAGDPTVWKLRPVIADLLPRSGHGLMCVLFGAVVRGRRQRFAPAFGRSSD